MFRRTHLLTIFLAAATLIPAGLAAQEQIELKPRFVPATAKPGDRVVLEVEATVLPGWHTYGKREKGSIPISLGVESAGGLKKAGDAKIPDGHKEIDGPVEQWVLTGTFVLQQAFEVPKDLKAGTVRAKVKVGYMVCDERHCEPPAEQSLSADLTVLGDGSAAPASRPASQKPASAPAKTEKQEPGDAPPQSVEFSARFVPASARPGERAVLEVEGKVAEGWHTYGALETGSTPVGLIVEEKGSLAAAGSPQIPDGDKDDSTGMTQFLLHGTFVMRQAFDVPKDAQPGSVPLKLRATYIACDESHCEPPGEQALLATLTVEAGDVRAEHAPTAVVGQPKPPAAGKAPGSDLMSLTLWQLLIAGIGAGLFTLAMPCSYPMIPITISFFTKQATARSTGVLPLALCYGLGIIVMFMLIGAVFAGPIVAVASHWLTNLLFGLAFVFFALTLFGFINLQPPQALTEAASKASRQGGYVGVFLMGFVFVITSFTCTAPFVGNVLVLAGSGSEGSMARVLLMMAIFGVTCAAPFVVLALMPSKLQALPRSGVWMKELKVFLGFVEIAAALKFLSNAEYTFQLGLMPREVFLWLWALLLGAAGLYLLGLFRARTAQAPARGPVRLAGASLTLMYAGWCAWGGLGAPLDEISDAIAPPYHARSLAFFARGSLHTIIKDDYDGALAKANAEHRWLLVNFTGFT